MSEYLMKILGVIIISTVFANLLPTGKTTMLIRSVLRLCLYLSILSPVYEFVLSLAGKEASLSKIFPNYFSETVIQTDESFIKYCSEKSVEQTEALLTKSLMNEYNVNARATIKTGEIYSDEGIKIEEIYIELLAEYEERFLNNLQAILQKEYGVSVKFVKGG